MFSKSVVALFTNDHFKRGWQLMPLFLSLSLFLRMPRTFGLGSLPAILLVGGGQ